MIRKSINITVEQEKQLKQLSKQSGEAEGTLIRWAITKYLFNKEYYKAILNQQE